MIAMNLRSPVVRRDGQELAEYVGALYSQRVLLTFSAAHKLQ